MTRFTIRFTTALVFSLGCCAWADTLSGRLDSLLSEPPVAGAQVGVYIYDITSDKVIYDVSGEKLFIPASNMKLFTSAAALELLGPGYRFETEFHSNGEIDNKGRIRGDLVIVGGGDPLISGRFRPRITEVLECCADSLKARGITKIEGKIVTDNTLFGPPELGPAWSWDDLSYWYACPISALSFNDNCVDLKFLPGKKVGDPARIELNPATDYIKVHNLAVTAPAESSFTLDYYRVPGTNEVTFFGGIPISNTAGEIDYVSVHDPARYTATIFADVLKARKIEVSSGIASLDKMKAGDAAKYSPEKLRPLFTWRSDSLGSFIKVINTNSQNLFAEQTLRILGVEMNGVGTFAGGISAASLFFDSIGISGRELIIYDGSGLSYLNLVKPEAIIKLLIYMSKSPNYDIYNYSLASPGIDRGMRNRLTGNPHRGNVRAKSGNIANVATLSGYLTGPKDGHLYAFSIMLNNHAHGKSVAEAWQDSVLAVLLREF